MKYQNINLLDAKIETVITKTVKHYYTDWKNYDRPKYMKCKGSSSNDDKKLILLARECGTYLVKIADAKKNGSWAHAIIEYYTTQDKSDLYYIDINKFELTKIQPENIKKVIATV